MRTTFRKPPKERKPKADPVTPELREAVFRRDGMCVAAKLDPQHVCRDAWGTPHDPRALARLSLEHIKPHLMAGRRGPSTAEWTVALCMGANVGVPSKELRAALREYLRTVQEPEHTHVEPVPGCVDCYAAFG